MGLIIDVFLCIKKILVLNIVIASGDGSFLVRYFGEVGSSGQNAFLNKITTVFINAGVLNISFPRS